MNCSTAVNPFRAIDIVETFSGSVKKNLHWFLPLAK
jgi:hypothetical protein